MRAGHASRGVVRATLIRCCLTSCARATIRARARSYLLSMILGAIMYAIFVASLTSLIGESDSSGRAYQTKLDSVNQYIAHAKLPTEIKNKLRTYFDLCFPQVRLGEGGDEAEGWVKPRVRGEE